MKSREIEAVAEAAIRVDGQGVEIGDYRVDLWVADRVTVEIKVARSDNVDDEPQLRNDLNKFPLPF